MSQIDLFNQGTTKRQLTIHGQPITLEGRVPVTQGVKGGLIPILIDINDRSPGRTGWTGRGRPPLWVVDWAKKRGITNLHRDVLVSALRHEMLGVML